MNRQLVIGAVAGAVIVTAMGTAAGYRMLDQETYASVVAVKPVTKTVLLPREACRDENVNLTRDTKDPGQIAGTVAGAVVGGVVGSQIGGGSGKKVATVGGAVAGGYAGNKIQEGMQERNTYQESRRVCKTVYDRREEQVGYDVTYQVGEEPEQSIRMDYDPGRRIPMEDGALAVRQQADTETMR